MNKVPPSFSLCNEHVLFRVMKIKLLLGQSFKSAQLVRHCRHVYGGPRYSSLRGLLL